MTNLLAYILKIRVRGEGGKEIHENARSENPHNCALVKLSWAEDFEVRGSYQQPSNEDGVSAKGLGCLFRQAVRHCLTQGPRRARDGTPHSDAGQRPHPGSLQTYSGTIPGGNSWRIRSQPSSTTSTRAWQQVTTHSIRRSSETAQTLSSSSFKPAIPRLSLPRKHSFLKLRTC